MSHVLRKIKRDTRNIYDKFKLILSVGKKKRVAKNYNEAFKVLNVGGVDIVRDNWRSLDFNSRHYNHPSALIDYNVDLEKKRKWPIKDNSYNLVYCSHILEHLSQEAAMYTLKEIYRVLKARGGLRLVVPNMDLALQHYGDKEWWGIHFPGMNCEDAFMNFFASDLVGKMKYDKSKNLDYYRKKITNESQERNPGNHRNWFTFVKVKRLLEEAGFKGIEKSQPRQSKFNEFCQKGIDKTAEELSLYVDALK